jgi:hypothetical protein
MHRDETIITDLCLTIKADTLTRIIHISNSIFYVSTFSYTKIKQEADFDNPPRSSESYSKQCLYTL